MNVIVIEGIPGAGKTAIALWLSQQLGIAFYPEDILVPEVFALWRAYRDDDVQLFLQHWETKASIAKLLDRDCIWDRNHISALAYNYAKARVRQDAEIFDEVLRWYREGITKGTLLEPSVYLLLDVTPEMSLQRRVQTSAECYWASAEGLGFSREFYETLEEFLSRHSCKKAQPQVIRIPGDGPLAEIQTRVLAALC